MGSRWIIRGIVVLAAITSLTLSGDLPAGQGPQPGATGEYVPLSEAMKTVRESDIENPRAKDARRKASQDKWPGLGWQTERAPTSLYEMEEIAWPHFDEWTWPQTDYPVWGADPDTGQYVGSNPSGGVEPGGGGAWRVCRPEAGGYYVECGEMKQWNISQPPEDIIELIAFGGPGILLAANNDYIKFQAKAGADDGQQIQIAYEQTPVVGGVYYPSFTCEKTYHVQCEDECPCVGDTPTIYGDSATIDRPGGADPSVDLWVGTGFACGPFTWSVSGTGFHFGSTSGPTTGETEEELEIITLYTDATACGAAEITVTDSCGVTTTTYVRCTEGRWRTCNSGAIGGCTSTGAGYLYIYFDNPVCRAGFNCAASGGSTSCIGFTGSESYCQRCYGNVACPSEVCASGKACSRVAYGWTCP